MLTAIILKYFQKTRCVRQAVAFSAELAGHVRYGRVIMNSLKKLLVLLLLAMSPSASFAAVTNNQVFAYAAANYPSIFSGAVTAGQYQQYDYRYYAASKSYLAVDTAGVIWILGPNTHGVITSVGAVAAFAKTITAWQAWQTTQAVSVVSRYVATTGSDANSGDIDHPFQTIQRCATNPGVQVCQIRQGTYRETVMPQSGVVITAYKDETVTIDGTGERITGWTLDHGSVYRANVVLGAGDANQVFVGQEMMTEARWPNGDDLFHVNWGILKADTTATQLTLDSSLLNIASARWTGAKIHFWSGDNPWSAQTGAVAAAQNGQLTFAVDGNSLPDLIIPKPGGFYYLFGALALLDVPREWFYDKSAHVLYFRAPADANPDNLDVRVKQRQFAFDLSGRANVTIQNVKLFASSINTDAASSNNNITGITATYVSHYTALHNKRDPDTGAVFNDSYWFDHLYDSGIIIKGTGNAVQNSTISYSAGNGITVMGRNNVVRNNLIHHVDYMGNSTAGIAVQGAAQIQNNTVHSSGRNAIFADADGSQIAGTPLNVDIGYNNLYNAAMLSRDAGVIYSVSPSAPPYPGGSKIHHNWIHDTLSLYPGPASDYALPGVYLDEGSSGWQVYQNVLWNNQTHNIYLHGSTSDPEKTATSTLAATIQNNNTISGNSLFGAGGAANIALNDIHDCGSTVIENNKVMVQAPTLPVSQGVANTLFNKRCTDPNNSPTAPGANEMTSVIPGCDFSGCSSNGPPAQ